MTLPCLICRSTCLWTFQPPRRVIVLTCHVQVAMVHKEATKHDRSKWLTVVSRFFDKTGIRMDPEVARVALENS